MIDLVVLLTTSGGSPNFSPRVVTCRLWPLRPYARPPGSCRACFEFKLVRSHAEFVCYVVSFMKYWEALQNAEDRVLLEHGAEAL